MSNHLTRRGFIKGSAATAAVVFAGPRILTAKSPNSLVSVACIGTNGRGKAHVNGAGSQQIVALVDVDSSRVAEAAKNYPKAEVFSDYRKMYDKMEKKIDAVSVATPDHNHACASMMAIKRGKHVYCEKPLTWSVAEARALTEAAREYKVITQMGNQGHCQPGYRVLCEWIQAGAIGNVLETHSWTNRPIWPQGVAKRPPTKPVPDGLDWESWIGPAPFRDYHEGLHNFAWRGWLDFGAGALGDMACHIMDGTFWCNQLGYPTSVELLETTPLNDQTFPETTHIVWEFPARKPGPKDKIARPAMKVHWWDGGKPIGEPNEKGRVKRIPNRPPMVAELEKKYGRNLGPCGTLYIGEKGIMYTSTYGSGVGILDPDQNAEFKKIAPKDVLPKPRGDSFGDFYASIKEGKPSYSNFDYAGPFTETVLMGNLSLRAGKGNKVLWDGKNMKVTNLPELNRFVRREYRKGWTL